MYFATPNYSKQTFTIRRKEKGKTISKYKTFPLSKDEFEENENNSSNDWQQFLTFNSGTYETKF